MNGERRYGHQSERYAGVLAEREGFYYRRYLQVPMNTTLPR
jgi:hypothetical protein